MRFRGVPPSLLAWTVFPWLLRPGCEAGNGVTLWATTADAYSSHREATVSASASGAFRDAGKRRWRIASGKTSRSDEHLQPASSIPSRLQRRGGAEAAAVRQRQGLFLVLLLLWLPTHEWTEWMTHTEKPQQYPPGEETAVLLLHVDIYRNSHSLWMFASNSHDWASL